ncbi:hypothetical protein [Haladaptatus sp. DFWS20]|uniref:hypothetical protein n=1 Tax=Haladaptatus sp. DFWS20 TaxID=3403467 RepID=UPI003EBD8125
MHRVFAESVGRFGHCGFENTRSRLESRETDAWYVVPSSNRNQLEFGPGSPGEPRSVRAYISKMFATFRETAARSASELEDDLADGSWRDWWQLTLYWATGMRAWTRSQTLQTPAPATDPVPHYRRVGVARYDQFPEYVTDRAVRVSQLRSRPASAVMRGTDPPENPTSAPASSADHSAPAVAPVVRTNQ